MVTFLHSMLRYFNPVQHLLDPSQIIELDSRIHTNVLKSFSNAYKRHWIFRRVQTVAQIQRNKKSNKYNPNVNVSCLLSRVTCHVSGVTCYVSPATSTSTSTGTTPTIANSPTMDTLANSTRHNPKTQKYSQNYPVLPKNVPSSSPPILAIRSSNKDFQSIGKQGFQEGTKP